MYGPPLSEMYPTKQPLAFASRALTTNYTVNLTIICPSVYKPFLAHFMYNFRTYGKNMIFLHTDLLELLYYNAISF